MQGGGWASRLRPSVSRWKEAGGRCWIAGLRRAVVGDDDEGVLADGAVAPAEAPEARAVVGLHLANLRAGGGALR